MKAKKRDLVIIGLFTLLLVATAAVTNSPTWIKWRTLQTCDYTIIKPNGEQLHFSMERYACPELKCFPQGWNYAFQHNHLNVIMEHNSADGEKIGSAEHHFVHMDGYGLSIGYDYSPLALVHMTLDDYYGNIQEVKVEDDVNWGEVTSVWDFEYPDWGTVKVDDRRTKYESCMPSKDPSVDPRNNQGTGRGDTRF